MISYKYQCIFVHIPKAGGTSVEDVIWPSNHDRTEANLWKGLVGEYSNKYQTGGLQHLLASQIRQEVSEDIFNQFFKFTVVRNPWDKAVSQFSYMKTRPDLRQLIGMKENTEFKTYLALIQETKHIQWEEQYKFFLDENGEEIVDFVGRLENFNRDLLKILEKINRKSPLVARKIENIPHSKKSIRSHYKDYYDDESKEIVHQLYARDIDILGYTFE